MNPTCTCPNKLLRDAVFAAENQYLSKLSPSQVVHYANVVARVKHTWGLCHWCDSRLFALVRYAAKQAEHQLQVHELTARLQGASVIL
jgi:hypothetical protein